MEAKKCAGCWRTLPIEEFNFQNRAKNLRKNHCKLCRTRYYIAHLEERREYQRGYRLDNLEECRVRDASVRARRLRCEDTLTDGEWKSLLKSYDYRCAYDGAPFECIDHVRPLCMGGGNTRWNVVPACLRCNRLKGRNDWTDRLTDAFVVVEPSLAA